MDTNVFPLPFSVHLIFVAVAVIFFIVQFVRLRYKYQIVMAVAVAMTMLVYLNDSRLWFYGTGLVEFGLIVFALVISIVEKKKRCAVEGETGVEFPSMPVENVAETGEE